MLWAPGEGYDGLLETKASTAHTYGEKSASKMFNVTQEQNLPGVCPRPPQAYGFVSPFLHTNTHQKKGRKRQIGCSRASPAARRAEPRFCAGRRRAAACTRSWLCRGCRRGSSALPRTTTCSRSSPQGCNPPSLHLPLPSPTLPPPSERGRISVPGPPRAPRALGTGTSGPQVMVTPIPPQMLTLHGWVIHGAELEEIRDLPREKGWKT